MRLIETCPLLFAIVFLLPIAVSALRYRLGGIGPDWRTADRSSIGHLPPADRTPHAVLRIFAARTVRWRGIVASHCWIVFKAAGDAAYTRYDYTAWGEPIRLNGFEPDGRWFGQVPMVVFAADGAAADALLPGLVAAIAGYGFHRLGDYRAWPGPNSNTFVAAVMDAMPGIRATLPPTAIGKDFPHDGRWLRRTPSGTGFRCTWHGYLGVTLAWVEGVEISVLGFVAGLDIRRPAIKLPGLGRMGMT